MFIWLSLSPLVPSKTLGEIGDVAANARISPRGRRRDWSPESAHSANGIFISVTRRGVSNMWDLSARTPQRPQFERKRYHQRAYGENERPDQQDDRKRARRRERQQQ